MTSVLRRVLPIACVAAIAAGAITIGMPHAPALADAGSSQSVCGDVNLNTASGADATKAFDCFTNAFSKCSPATLFATGTDAGQPASWTFTTVDGGVDYGCSVAETLAHGNPGATTTDTYLCHKLSRDKDGALLVGGCGAQGDVALRIGASQANSATQTSTGKS